MANLSVNKNVRVFSTQGSDFTISTSASTWGDLKSTLSSNISNIDSMRAIVQSTKQTLELDDASLPEKDFILFLTPTQVKSGSDEELKINKEEVKNLPYNVLRSTMSRLNISVHGTKADLVDRFEKHLERDISRLEKKEAVKGAKRVSKLAKVSSNYNKLSIEDKLNALKNRVVSLMNNDYNEKTVEELSNVKVT